MPIRKVIMKKENKKFVEDLDRDIVISREKTYYVEDLSKDFSTEHGTIKKSDYSKNKVKINNDEFNIVEASFIDTYRRIRKLAQTINLKDIGTIITETGLTKNSIVVEAGTGSAALSIMLAQHCKKVISYEINDKHLEQAKKNIEFCEIENITIKQENIESAKIPVCDLVVLDLPEPFKAIKNIKKYLKTGGFIVTYNPCITQSMQTVEALDKNNFWIIKTVENIQRDWIIDGKKVRPHTQNNIHTGFLTIARKIED